MKKKNLGQIFTPENFVNLTLDNVGYMGDNILNRKILEPSFGDGAFLLKIIERLLTYCLELNFTEYEISEQLSRIYGIEIDEELFNVTKDKIKHLLDSYGLKCYEKVNLYCMDALEFDECDDFDFVVGNPPYVRVHNMETSVKEKVNNFNFNKGQADLYILFFELGLSLLNENGKLAYITPNSYFKNSSQKDFRGYLIENNLLEKVIDFKSNQIFKNAKTYTAISVLNKAKTNNEVYVEILKKDNYIMKINELSLDKEWVFLTHDERSFIADLIGKGDKLSSIADIQHGIVTNRDKIFIGDIKELEDGTVYFNDAIIEKGILKPAFKSSKSKHSHILFPYVYNEMIGKYQVMEEDYLKNEYPLAYSYLLSHKMELSLRDMESGLKWYQFARSQGFTNLKKKKLTFKHILKSDIKELEVVELDEDIAVYSGLYITAKNEEDFYKIKSILNSDDFLTYLLLVGKDFQNDYKFLTGNNIKGFNCSF